MERHDRYLNQVLRLTLGRAIDWHATADGELSADPGGTTVRLGGDPEGACAATPERDTTEPAMWGADRSDFLRIMDLLRYRVLAG